tara:strand:+ start:589 stop:801 length:213 start_codon:yes stop_codon:yes gene_type:complete
MNIKIKQAISILEELIDEKEKEIEEDNHEYGRDETLDLISSNTGCEACDPNHSWGVVRGIEASIRKLERL